MLLSGSFVVITAKASVTLLCPKQEEFKNVCFTPKETEDIV